MGRGAWIREHLLLGFVEISGQTNNHPQGYSQFLWQEERRLENHDRGQ
jgi:hypothetical protein